MALSTQKAFPCPPWAESAPRWKYDVFLSFRGEEGFTSHLYHELQFWQAIKTFKDDRELEIGATLSPELLGAIKQSHLAIVVLSRNYAFSTRCLDELAKIVESMEARKNTIFPVFLDVDPSDVRHQRRSFAEAFAEYEDKYSDDIDKVKRWRAALTNVANFSGWESKNYECEREFIKVIVKYVWDKVHPTVTLSGYRDKLVGIDVGLVELGWLLDLEAKDVRFIGLWGMGGVGKTTRAKLAFERISHQFEVSEFLADVREVYANSGTLVDLQKQLLSPILKENINQVWDEQEGIFFIQKCLFNKKVLLIIDDVDSDDQLKLLVGNKSWFGEGSRIIITTRDEHLLIKHDLEMSLMVNGLNDSAALELFSQNAFKKDWPKEGFLELSKCFVDYAKGLPLALKILGRSLYKRDLEEWNSALNQLKEIPDATIFQTLKLSYDALNDMQKDIFLDVAFFYKGMKKGLVIELLDGSYGLSCLFQINVLIEKSLLTIEVSNNAGMHEGYHNVGMHGLVQDMAWEIVRQESSDEPGLRSRLCHRNDIFHVFMRNTATKAIKGIRLCLPILEEAGPNWNCECLSKMPKLMFLEFDNLIISLGPKFLPNSLRILKWNWYPSKYLPAGFRPNLLAELKMQKSKLIRLWDGNQDLPNLKYMDLSDSQNLNKTPDFTGIPKLEVLILAYCTRLVEIHPSIAVNKKLKWLILEQCKSIKSFPSEIEMDSLEILNLYGCSKIKIPNFGEGMEKLSYLHLCGTASKQIPSSIEHLVDLTTLRPCFTFRWFSTVLSTQRVLPYLPWAESVPGWKYDVFLSFRGEDTRWSFTSHLYHELQYWQAFKTFKDDRELQIGASISPELFSAIEQSHLAIVVLSPNYASSTWCLDELAKIVESMEMRDKAILPVFLDVDPSDVRHQRRSFAEAFAKHEKKFSDDIDKVERWRAALTKVANSHGCDSKNYKCERELIKVIVKCVWRKVRPTITLSDSKDKLDRVLLKPSLSMKKSTVLVERCTAALTKVANLFGWDSKKHDYQRKMTPKRKRNQLESQENVKRTKKDEGQENVVS